MQAKLRVATEWSGRRWFVPVDSRSGTRSEGETAKVCGEERQSRSTLSEMHVRQKEKVGMPVVSESAAVERGMCETEKVDEGPASGKCEDEHPVVTMMFWPINDA